MGSHSDGKCALFLGGELLDLLALLLPQLVKDLKHPRGGILDGDVSSHDECVGWDCV